MTPTTEADPSPEPTPEPASDDPVADALNAALEGEHAAVYAYGVIGAHLIDDDRDRAANDLTRHRAGRDRLGRHLRDLDATPAVSLPTYALPFPVEDSATAADLADHIEERLAGLYADVVTAAEGNVRADAAMALVQTARARAAWSATVTAFPGLDERLDLGP